MWVAAGQAAWHMTAWSVEAASMRKCMVACMDT